MGFVVEDGTGIANATSYIGVAFFRGYFSDRGRDVRGFTDAQVKAFCIRATDFIEQQFGQQFKGTRTTLTQALSFPREDVTVDGVDLADDTVPVLLQYATAEYAYRASKYMDLSPDSPVPFDREGADGSTISGGGAVVHSREKVGPIEEEKTFSDPTAINNRWAMPKYPAADSLIQPLLSGPRSGRTIRA
ncbi:MAG: hypothetical protein IT435_02350 [Phycisphaerales bacterium]|nr:hypothetical protein [Phycisphaerales bacterium]